MASSPNMGYATISVIPSLRDFAKIADAELSKIMGPMGTAAGKEAGQAIAKGIASSDSEVTSATQRLFESASGSKEGEAIGRQFGTGVESGLASSTSDLGSEISSKLRGETADLGRLGDSAGRDFGLGLTDAASDELAEFSTFGSGVGADAGRNVSAGFGSGLQFDDAAGEALGALGPLLTNPATVIGVGAAAALTKGFADALNFSGVEAKIRAGLGASAAEAERLGDITQDLFRGNYGDSIEQSAEAVTLATRNMADLSEDDLKTVAQAALTTSTVFDQDLNSSINAASQLIRTGLAGDATEAFDLITKGLQGPSNKADDLLDTFNEYPTLFRNLGLEGPEALGLINQAVLSGARDSDVAADALKEYAIRAVDGSKATADGYALIGLSADDMARRVSAGGESAAGALDETLDRLRDLPDPTLRAQAAAALFGTQAEDLGDALFAMDLDTATEDLGEWAGAAALAAENAESMVSNVELVKRAVLGFGADWANEMLEPISELLRSPDADLSLWQQYGDDVGNALADSLRLSLGALGFLPGVPDPSRLDFSGDEDTYSQKKAEKAASDRYQAQADLLGIVEESRAADHLAAITAGTYGDALEYAARRAELLAFNVDLSETAVSGFTRSIEDSSSLDDMLSTTLNLADGFMGLKQSIVNLSSDVDISDLANGLTTVYEDSAAVLRDVISVGDQAQASIASALEFQGADAAIARADQIRQSFIDMFAGRPQEQVHELLESMGLLPEQIETAITVSGVDKAMKELEFLTQFANPDVPVPLYVESVIRTKIEEGDLEAAANLQSLFLRDAQDGLIQNPLLIRLQADLSEASEGLVEFRDIWSSDAGKFEIPVGAGTHPATESVQLWRRFESQTTVDVPVDANTHPAENGVDTWGAEQSTKSFTLGVGADMSQATTDVQNWARGLTANITGLFGFGGFRAGGGGVSAGVPYVVGEHEAELFVPRSDGTILNQSQIADALPSFGATAAEDTINLTYNMVEKAPSASDIARAKRRARVLSGRPR